MNDEEEEELLFDQSFGFTIHNTNTEYTEYTHNELCLTFHQSGKEDQVFHISVAGDQVIDHRSVQRHALLHTNQPTTSSNDRETQLSGIYIYSIGTPN